ncbi:hypothetical protein [Parasphingorhabdus sp.]|uniref:hypothetical protein n=1 Tax=Parasphingorhabdus sp. TaxID=2709688 RepID=UPI0039E2D75E
MKQFSRYLIPVCIGLLTFAALRYFNPLPPKEEIANLECNFALVDETKPVAIPLALGEINEISLEAELTNKSIDDGVILWSAEGLAKFEGGTRELSGVVFTTSSDQIRGLGFWRDLPGERADYLRIMTLNQDGGLDWNESVAYAYFDSDPDKLNHPLNYTCKISRNN